ncbi:hypothetical protein ACM5Q9_02965 [Advenella sp. RU8]|uniref:hypothetical protein n=1 Tax=Advenella sp. RU8 TaxID=3399575 RepID=UPI003AB035DC
MNQTITEIDDMESDALFCPVTTTTFIKNISDDIYPLLELASNEPNATASPLLKSITVLLCSYWQTYCFNLGQEAFYRNLETASSATQLPLSIRKTIAIDINNSQDELAAWSLAGEQWRDRVATYFNDEQSHKIFNTYPPGTRQLEHYFQQLTGIEQISDFWHWEQDEYPFLHSACSIEQAREIHDQLMALPQEISNQQDISYLSYQAVCDYYTHILGLAIKTQTAIKALLEANQTSNQHES